MIYSCVDPRPIVSTTTGRGVPRWSQQACRTSLILSPDITEESLSDGEDQRFSDMIPEVTIALPLTSFGEA